MGEGSSAERNITRNLLQFLSPDRNAGLSIGSIPADTLVEEFGSPLYVYDAGILQRNFEAVQAAVGSRVGILYALKANPNIAVAGVLRRAGAGAEVAGAGEVHAALAAGFVGEDMQFAGPGKTRSEITLGIREGLGSFNLESAAEYRELAAVARELAMTPRVAIRVNPQTGLSGARMRMSGGGKKFGVDADEVGALIEEILADGIADLRGLHTYGGTQNFDAEGWVSNARALVELADQLERQTGAELHSLNFGGGLGIPYYEQDPVFDLEVFGDGLRRLIEDDAREDRSYWTELGRYLAATAGVYLTRVTYIKESGGSRHAILEGGLHQHSAAAGVGSIMRRSYPIVSCSRPYCRGEGSITLGGPLCTPADEFAADVDLPELSQGDIVAILASGAYGLTFSNVMFLSHPLPAEVLVDAGKSFLVRERGGEKDHLRGQKLPDGE